MGSRINYVIKKGDQLTIYHNRWGAQHIAAHLYAGQDSFFKYLKNECTIEIALRQHLWMEGFVIADTEKKILGFWAWEFEKETSVIRYYLSALQHTWPDWQVLYLPNEMYDASPLLGIDYYADQKIQTLTTVEEADVINDPLTDEYSYTLFMIRQNDQIFTAETTNIQVESIICYGKDIIDLLKARPAIPIPAEGQSSEYEHLFIDVDNKNIIANLSIYGLWETMGSKWPGYTFKMGRIGYLALLEEANIPTAGLAMSHEAILEKFNQMILPPGT